MIRTHIVFFIFASYFLTSCNQPFDPRGPLNRKLVVYSILSTDRAQQFVRLEQSYMPASYDPQANTSDKSVVGALVILRSVNSSYVLRDTAFGRSDTSRYLFPIRSYVLSPFVPQYGSTYQIAVRAPEFDSITATVSIPGKPSFSLDITSVVILDRPGYSDSSATIVIPMTLGSNTKAFSARLFVDYEVLKNGAWFDERVEIPLSFMYTGGEDYNYPIYPSLTVTPAIGRASGVYRNKMYLITLANLAWRHYVDNKIIFNRVVFRLMQFEPNLYKYYKTVHGYDDPHSTRLDDPGYSSIPGGEGLAGAYTVDSLVHPLPENFGFNKR
jgi:hypothetical protein